jgi:hypothetical protein
MSTCSVPCSPATRPAPWPWTSARVGPAARRRRSRDAGHAAALGYGRPSCQPGTANAPPSLPVRADAGGRPRRPRTTGHINRLDPTEGGPPHRATPGPSAARTARRQRRGHRRPVRPDTWMHRTSGHRTRGHRTPGRWTSARPAGRTPPRRDQGRGQGNDRLAGVRTSSRPATPAGGPTAPGSRRLETLGHPGRLRVTAPAAQPAAAMRPRPGALLSSEDWIEGRAGEWRPSGTRRGEPGLVMCQSLVRASQLHCQYRLT